jgi:hypothetical protein
MSFTEIVAQSTITGVLPTLAFKGDIVTINGVRLDSVKIVKLNTLSLNNTLFDLVDSTLITFQVPQNLKQGSINISLVNGTITSNVSNISLVGITISSLEYNGTEVDDSVTVNFVRADTILKIYFGNLYIVSNQFRHIGNNQVRFRIPEVNKVGSYPISIEDLYDSSPSVPFSVTGLNVPSISGVNPVSAKSGEFITITGANFLNTNSITFENEVVDSSDFSVIVIKVPFLIQSNVIIKVYTPRGASNNFSFTFNTQSRNVNLVEPQNPKTGNILTISGSNIGNAEAIIIGNDTLRGIMRIDLNKIGILLTNGVKGGLLKLVFSDDVLTTSLNLDIDTITTVSNIYDPENEFKIVLSQDDIYLHGFSANDRVFFFDLAGMTKLQYYVQNNNVNKVNINGWKPGVYILKVETNKGFYSKKIIKK